MRIEFIVPGEPIGKARPRVTRHGTFTPKKTRQYEELIRSCWLKQSGERFPDDVPIRMRVDAYFSVPKSLSKIRRMELIGEPHHKRPDIDNVCKIVQDACNDHAYKDDSRIYQVTASKFYAEIPMVKIVFEDYNEEENENA